MCLLIAWWAWRQVDEQRALDRWVATRRDGNLATIQATEVPDLAESHVERAQIRISRSFPPAREGARADLVRALHLLPMRSGIWFQVSQNDLFSSRLQDGREALRRSDELDPFFPAQRLRSIQLWSLLGERDRAVALARSVVSLGFEYRREAARELTLMGIDPVAIFDMVWDDELTPVQIGELIVEISTADDKKLDVIFARLADPVLDDKDFRSLALERASRPLAYNIVRELWRRDSPGVMDVGEGVALQNLDLRDPPFRGSLPLGWQQFPLRGVRGGSWVEPEMAGQDGAGAIRIMFPEATVGQKTVPLRYLFYRFPWRGAEPATVTVAVKSSATEGVLLWMTGRVGDDGLRGGAKVVGRDWTDLQMKLPPRTSAAMVELYIDGRNSRIDGEAPEVLIGRLGFDPSGEQVQP